VKPWPVRFISPPTTVENVRTVRTSCRDPNLMGRERPARAENDKRPTEIRFLRVISSARAGGLSARRSSRQSCISHSIRATKGTVDGRFTVDA
jgi:hypothetical protein